MLHLPVRTPSVKMRLECPAGHDKRPNQNDPSSKHGQSKAAAIQNSTIVKGLLHEGLCSNPFFIR